MEKKNNYRSLYFAWATIDKVLAIMPLLIYVLIRWNHYFDVSKRSVFSNVVGFLLVITTLIIVLIKKTQVLTGLGGLVIIEGVLIFLDVYVQDMKFILGLAIIGLFLSKLITQPFVSKYYKLYDKMETAEIQAESMKEVVDSVISARG